MAQTIFGTQGTVSEAQWAELMAFSSQKYVRDAIAQPTMLPNTSAPTSLRFPAYKSFGAGVMVKEDANSTISTPSGAVVGRWYLLVLRRTWGVSPSAALTWVATTTSTVDPPTSFPAGRQVVPGVVDDEPVGWYRHTAGSGVATWVSLSSLADGVVETKWALWDGREQGFTSARVTRDTDASFQWNTGTPEFYVWNPVANRWESRGNDTVTQYMVATDIQAPAAGGTTTVAMSFAAQFEFPPMVILTPVTVVPNALSVGASGITTSGFNLVFYRINNIATSVNVLVIGIPKRV